jgi:hypothetical protein
MTIGKTRPDAGVYLAVTHDRQSREDWVIVTDEPATLQTFAQYRLRFQVEEWTSNRMGSISKPRACGTSLPSTNYAE